MLVFTLLAKELAPSGGGSSARRITSGERWQGARLKQAPKPESGECATEQGLADSLQNEE